MDAPGKDSLVGDVQVDLDHASISCPAPHTPASGEAPAHDFAYGADSSTHRVGQYDAITINNSSQASWGSDTSDRPLISREPLSSTGSTHSLNATRRPSVLTSQASQRVRDNVNHELQASQRRSRTYYAITMCAIVAQVLAAVVVLALHWNDPCESPLNMWCTVYAVRLSLVGLLRTYVFVMGLPDFGLVDRENGQMERWKSSLELFGLVWFIMGNYWTFRSDECTGYPVFNLSLSFIVLGYMYLLLPLIICMCLMCCLPCVLIAMRYMKVDRGATEDMIAKNTDKMVFTSAMYEPEDCHCVICLGDYEENEELRKLPCKHHFHLVCVDQWLKINQACPLCVQSINKSNDESALETESV